MRAVRIMEIPPAECPDRCFHPEGAFALELKVELKPVIGFKASVTGRGSGDASMVPGPFMVEILGLTQA